MGNVHPLSPPTKVKGSQRYVKISHRHVKIIDAAGGSVANLVRDVTSNSYSIEFVAAFVALSTFATGVIFKHYQATLRWHLCSQRDVQWRMSLS